MKAEGSLAPCRFIDQIGTVVCSNTRERNMDKSCHHIPSEMLPKEAEVMSTLIGLEATMTLVKAYGGRRLYIPSKAAQKHKLAPLIGLENLEALSKHYQGERISIPKCERALKYLRNQKIRSAYGPTSMSVLAQTYGLSESQITRIVA